MGNVIVIGSYAVDLTSRAPRLPKPGETVLGGPFQMGPGGKGGNQAAAAARSGASVAFVTKIGDDLFGKAALAHFQKEKFNTKFVYISKTEATGAALITVDEKGENSIVIAPGACGAITKEEVAKARSVFEAADLAVLQLEINMEAISEAIELAVESHLPLLFNPAPYLSFPEKWLKYMTYITPNETEAKQLTGILISDESAAQKAANWMHEKGVQTVIITLGGKGVFLSKGMDKGKRLPAFPVNAMDTTGAGDAFNGAFAHAVSSGQELEEAVCFGQAAAALSVTKSGAARSMPKAEEIKRFLQMHI